MRSRASTLFATIEKVKDIFLLIKQVVLDPDFN